MEHNTQPSQVKSSYAKLSIVYLHCHNVHQIDIHTCTHDKKTQPATQLSSRQGIYKELSLFCSAANRLTFEETRPDVHEEAGQVVPQPLCGDAEQPEPCPPQCNAGIGEKLISRDACGVV
jgi:hypothetical protein